MFSIGDKIVCLDSYGAYELKSGMEYVVLDYSDCFVIVETVDGRRVYGDWHETRFCLADVE